MSSKALVADNGRICLSSVSADMFSEAYSMADFRRGLVCDRELSLSVDKISLAQALTELCHARLSCKKSTNCSMCLPVESLNFNCAN